MLIAKSASWFKTHYEVQRDDQVLTTLKFASMSDAGSFELAGEQFEVRRDGFAGWFGNFQLSLGERVIATVERPKFFSRRHLIQLHSETAAVPFELRPAGWFTSKYRLDRGQLQLGTVSKTFWSLSGVEVDLSSEVPLPIQILVLWVVLEKWRKQTESS